MSLTLFFVDAFSSALDRGIASPAELIRHVTPEVLSVHLPRHLWARLLTACLGAPRVDAGVIVDTIGIPNLCEHMPKPLLWACLAEIAATALGGKVATATPTATAAPTATATQTATPAPAAPTPARSAATDTLLPPPPSARRPGSSGDEARAAANPSAFAASLTTNHSAPAPSAVPSEAASASDSGRTRTPTRPPARTLGTSRSPVAAGASSRRPQVAAAPPTPPPGATPAAAVPAPPRSLARDLDFEVETDIHMDWKDKEPIPVTDEMVDWPAAEETASGAQLDRNKR